MISDKDTGEPRELDATIRYTLGSIPVLVIVECRKRSRVQDVQWIEHVVQKQQSVGANVAVAVASKGFSRAAMKKGAAKGVLLRTLREVEAPELLESINQELKLRVELTRVRVMKYSFALASQPPAGGAGLAPELAAAWAERGDRAALLFEQGTDEPVPLHDFVTPIFRSGRLPRPSAEGGSESWTLTFVPERALYTLSTRGKEPVSRIRLELTVNNEGNRPVEVERVHEYVSDNERRVVAEASYAVSPTDRWQIVATEKSGRPLGQ